MKIKTLFQGILSGILIVIGCTVYLSCENKYVGAVLFSVALLSICSLNLPLFTGSVGFVKSLNDIINLLLCLAGNTVGCAVAGLSVGVAYPEVSAAALASSALKFGSHPVAAFAASVMCGILMYTAVYIYRNNEGISRYIGILICVPTFILCRFEHSIANLGYLFIAKAGITNLLNLPLFIIGNAAGSLLIRFSKT
ncbi:MAG: formate/nitrite transporter family protein [Oscillospiraceae bacterium]|jgi:nitrite transporter NirC|nr:formate/nitrite transporter family protein [Oscillospiraceae bacterium]